MLLEHLHVRLERSMLVVYLMSAVCSPSGDSHTFSPPRFLLPVVCRHPVELVEQFSDSRYGFRVEVVHERGVEGYTYSP